MLGLRTSAVLLVVPLLLLILALSSLLAQSRGHAGELIFSHRSHLARSSTECVTCHQGIPASKRSGDNNLPKEEDCLECHDGTRASNECSLCHKTTGTLAHVHNLERNHRFNHELHVRLGNIAPVLLGAIETGVYLSPPGDIAQHLDADDPCLACHRGIPETDLATQDHLPRMADCLACHRKIDPPYSCALCHTSDFRLKPQDHTDTFMELHSSRQNLPPKEGCKLCHGLTFSCMGCH